MLQFMQDFLPSPLDIAKNVIGFRAIRHFTQKRMFEEIVKHNGGNRFKVPHSGIAKAVKLEDERMKCLRRRM